MKLSFFCLLFIIPLLNIQSQETVRKEVRKGNNIYHKGDYQSAETCYKKAYEKAPSTSIIPYNLGNALLRQRKVKEAMTYYEKAQKMAKSPLYKAQIFHNKGVTLQSAGQYDQAIMQYENALRNNPKDDQTRYNLALCKRQQKEQDKKNNTSSKPKQSNENQKKPPKDEQNNKNKDKNKQDQQQQSSISKENAERLLNLSRQEEQEVQRKIKQRQRQPNQSTRDKNW